MFKFDKSNLLANFGYCSKFNFDFIFFVGFILNCENIRKIGCD